VPKLVLRDVLSGNIHLVAFWGMTTNHVSKFFDLSPIELLVEEIPSEVNFFMKKKAEFTDCPVNFKIS
jgi:hypothetical protein